MTGGREQTVLERVAPRLARAYAAEKAREPLRWHIGCADCQFVWWADGKPTTECPRCGSRHLRAGAPDGTAFGGTVLLDCEVCGAEYGQSCVRERAS